MNTLTEVTGKCVPSVSPRELRGRTLKQNMTVFYQIFTHSKYFVTVNIEINNKTDYKTC
jgi:hypothetical protein